MAGVDFRHRDLAAHRIVERSINIRRALRNCHGAQIFGINNRTRIRGISDGVGNRNTFKKITDLLFVHAADIQGVTGNAQRILTVGYNTR